VSERVLSSSLDGVGPVGERRTTGLADPDVDGVELFLQRAADADATFVAGDDRTAIVDLCRHLDGIPLAIELAAARVRAMTPIELLSRLRDRFRLLRGGTRGGLDRHRTLAATLDWSYNLLQPQEQQLLDSLAVFPASFDLAGVERICLDDCLDLVETIDLMGGLVDKSMVVAERSPAGTRYRLLETVRAYAETHTDQDVPLALRREHHLEHYLSVAETAFKGWLNDYTSGRIVLDREWDNVRAATQHAHESGDTTTLERLFSALSWPASYALTYEVGDWAEQATKLAGAGPATFGTAATMAAMLGRFDEGERLAQAGIAAANEPNAANTWMCWTALYQGLSRAGRTEAAHTALLAAHRTATEALGPWGDAFFSSMLSVMSPLPVTGWNREAASTTTN
jgi:predicted ATPase